MGQKRRRIALSCVDCRRRKVKCDRTYPSCVRCQKGGYGDKCVYVTHTGEAFPTPEDERDGGSRANSAETWADEAEKYRESARNHEAAALQRPSNVAVATEIASAPRSQRSMIEPDHQKLRTLQGRLMDLETYVHAAGGKPVSSEMHMGIGNPNGPGYGRDRNYYSDTYKLEENEKVLLRGQSFKTQYFGPSHTLAILLQFQDLSNFVREILMTLPSLSTAKHSMSKIREAEKKAANAQYDVSIETLVAMVPERPHADRLVHEYLDSIETTYRILHVPTFLKDYEVFWTAPKESKPEFVVQLLLAMSTVYCIIPGGETGFVGRSSARRETAAHWINVCNYWQQSQSNKHVSLANYQIHIQLWLARRVNCIKVKREWTEIGALVRRFMAAGLHREPSLLCGKINTFDCEMRRRLWYTVLELDLQTTIDRGITPTLGPMDWDTTPPRNINDEEFNLDTKRLPESKPRNTFTRTAFLAWAAESLPLRIELLYKINSIRNHLELDTVVQYDDKLRAIIDEIPIITWEESSPSQSSTSSSSPSSPTASLATATSTIPFALAQTMLYELITILHQPFATDASLKTRHFLSRSARRYACLAILLIYNPQLTNTDTSGPTDQRLQLSEVQRRYLYFMREDNLRAALSLAHDFAISSSPTSNTLCLHLQDDNRPIALIDAAVSMLSDRVRNLGQGFHCYWITSSALSFVHSKQSPHVPRSTFARAAADRVVKLHSLVMDGQLPRAKRMLISSGEHGVPPRSVSPSSVAMIENARTDSNEKVVAVTSVEGVIGLQSGNGGLDNGNAAFAAQPMMGLNGMNASCGMMGWDANAIGGESIAYLQDTMFGIENMDWNVLLNADPTIFMMGGYDYPS
ncbi:hypothetical protein H2198_005004 [Neophaeococcomyces mojaviensis]|uniref:Uncharacterized protein n=1 Tax=Neophaeococcomyces mojaviensis TaxID=3383035 RepID=A0ACC3A6T4_9EURO|nr:hypothetical protein H2198_005004 [Knufia sp. JES_112]